MSRYDATAERALNTIADHGAAVSFPGAASGPAYNEQTDQFSGTPGSAVTGQAVQIDGDPDRMNSLGLVLINPVTLMIAALGLSVTPVADMKMNWAGTVYTIKDVNPVAPDGVPIIYIVTGST